MNRRARLLSDDPAALRAALVRYARLDGPSQQTRERLVESVVTAGVVSAGTGIFAAAALKPAGAVSTAKVGSFVVAKWTLSGALAATAALGAREAVIHYEAERAPHAQTVAMQERAPGRRHESGTHVAAAASSAGLEAQRAPDGPPPLAAEATPITAPAPVETASPAAPPAASRGGKIVNTAAPDMPPIAATAGAGEAPAIAARVASTVRLSHELALLERTRAHLAQQAPLSALDVLGDYERSFPDGALRIEAWALRVEALSAAGQRREAAILARAFLAAHSSNPMAHRVRTLLLLLEKPLSGP